MSMSSTKVGNLDAADGCLREAIERAPHDLELPGRNTFLVGFAAARQMLGRAFTCGYFYG